MPEEEVIRLLLLPLAGDPVLVPTALVAEVTAYVSPEPAAGAPLWVLGHVHWRARQVPLVSLERALGRDEEGGGGRPRNMVVLHGVADEPGLPFYAVPTKGPPRPRTVSAADLRADGGSTGPYGWGRVRLKDEGQGEIADLDRLERDLAATAPPA